MIQGHFINARSGQLFVCQFGKANPDKTVLLLPSLFEEMNLSRAIVAKQAQFLATQGYCVYSLDYFGTGDSEGEIHQASVAMWLENIEDSLDWLVQQSVRVLTLWGVRFGALLAIHSVTAAQQKGLSVPKLLFWKPVLKGKQFATQFLRVKQVNSMVQGGDKVDWRAKIKDGEQIEVAGYPLTEALMSGLESLQFPQTLAFEGDVHWMELASDKLTPAIQIATKQWPPQHLHISTHEGSAFWQIPEIFEQAFLHQATLDHLQATS